MLYNMTNGVLIRLYNILWESIFATQAVLQNSTSMFPIEYNRNVYLFKYLIQFTSFQNTVRIFNIQISTIMWWLIRGHHKLSSLQRKLLSHFDPPQQNVNIENTFHGMITMVVCEHVCIKQQRDSFAKLKVKYLCNIHIYIISYR